MLRSLTIENFAIIEHIDIDFEEGMTVLSGETGAGKSIIIDAFSLLMGGRGSVDFIRHGTSKLIVEGLFMIENNSYLEDLFSQYGLDINLQQDDLLIRREINLQGKNLVRINGQLANVTILKEIGLELADIHGQNEHQQLLDNRQHLMMLDQFSDESFQEKIQAYHIAYNEYQSLRTSWLEAQTNEIDQQNRLNYLKFQWEELDGVNFERGEEETLERMSQKVQNQQEIQTQLSTINELMSEGETSIVQQMDVVIDAIQKISRYDETYSEHSEKLLNYKFEIEEIAHFFAQEMVNKLDNLDDFDEIEERLSLLSHFKRKYAMTIDELMDYKNQIELEMNNIIYRDQYLDDIYQHLIPAYEKTLHLADELHELRIQSAKDLKVAVESELSDLYMKQSHFSVKFTELDFDSETNKLLDESIKFRKLNKNGYDQVEFYIATNLGEEAKPLVKVASGGELSRFMLALKVVFSRGNLPKVMIFDEIDTGVSGRVAFAIAQKMKMVSQYHQVLAITHLPQVAAIADRQLYIEKATDSERTYTKVSTLNESDRYQVIASMMTGEKITEASIQIVKDMINQLAN